MEARSMNCALKEDDIPQEETKFRCGSPMIGLRSRPLYAPARTVAQEGDTHLYVFAADGLWYHFPPKGWKQK